MTNEEKLMFRNMSLCTTQARVTFINSCLFLFYIFSEGGELTFIPHLSITVENERSLKSC